jgi:titin
MRQHARRGRPDRPESAEPAPRTRHPLLFALGALIVIGVVAAAGYAAWYLYTTVTWQTTAETTAAEVAQAVQDYSRADDTPPVPVDAVATNPSDGQVLLADLPYSAFLPTGVQRLRIADGGALSVLTTSQALCSGAAFDLSAVGRRPTGALICGEPVIPQPPIGLTASPRDRSVLLDWALPFAPVDDYLIAVSADGGETWRDVSDGVTSRTEAVVRPLANGTDYLFAVTAVNLLGQSGAARTEASPFTEPSAPLNVTARGGFDATVSWQPPVDDGGRPVTEYVVTGAPSGLCRVPATARTCTIEDLPAAAGYSFTVRAVNEAGPGVPAGPTESVEVFSVPGPPVAVLAAPGDRLVLLRWTQPLSDGNTPITDYVVDYRRTGSSDEWIEVAHPPSTQTLRPVPGLTNGTAYEFRVRAKNAVGVSEPPLTLAVETPATIPGRVPNLTATEADGFVSLTWQPPASDGGAPVTGYAVEYRPDGGSWRPAQAPVGGALASDVTGLVNGTRYDFRIAATNRMGTGAWSTRAKATPFGPPGPVRKPESVGSRTAVELTWKTPANDGGRPLRGYRIEYRLSSSPQWLRAGRTAPEERSFTVGDLVPGESYDLRIVAVNSAGEGPPTASGLDQPTLAGVIADETPPAPGGLTAVPGDGRVRLDWDPVPAGPDSPIVAYTVTGSPDGTCVTKRTSCVITGLTNGVRYAFTVNAANANITGPESAPVRAMPMVYNEAGGGTVTTYTEAGRTYRVHTFTSDGTFTVTRAEQPFSVLVVSGGGGSTAAPDGTTYPGGGGGIIEAPRVALTAGAISVTVGAGGPAGAPGGSSAVAGLGAAPAGPAGSATANEFSPKITSAISGRSITYGGAGTATSGQGRDGRGVGGGGPAPNRGGNGVVIIRYEIAD